MLDKRRIRGNDFIRKGEEFNLLCEGPERPFTIHARLLGRIGHKVTFIVLKLVGINPKGAKYKEGDVVEEYWE